MPYIKPTGREALDDLLGRALNALEGASKGELNYFITQLVLGRLDDRGITYDELNDAVGVIECVKLELYRRVVAPYEDKKRDENGDVY